MRSMRARSPTPRDGKCAFRISFPIACAEWLAQAEDFRKVEFKGVSKLDFLVRSVTLRKIEIAGPRAVTHNQFD